MDEHVILSIRDGATLDWTSPGGRVTIERSSARIALTDLTPGLDEAWRRLGSTGGTERELVAAAEGGDDLMAATLMLAQLRRCDQLGLLQYSVGDVDRRLLSVYPMVTGFYFSTGPVDPAARWRLSRFAYCRRHDHGLILESPLATSVAILSGATGGALVALLAAPRTCGELAGLLDAGGHGDGLDRGSAGACLALLAAAGFLAAEGADGRLPEDDDPALVPWEFHDLAFHVRTRLGRHDHPFGGTFPFRSRMPPLPAVASPRSTEIVRLHAPDIAALARHDAPLGEVLERRASVRTHGEAPITAAELGEFLFRTARVREMRPPSGERPYESSSRPYPSGGAAYDLEVYVTVHACAGLSPGLYHYQPVDHHLERLDAPASLVDQLLRDAQQAAALAAPPQILITLASRFGRLSWKYRGIAYATTLKNVGVLYQTMYLVATAMGLAPCALGGGNSAAFSAAAGTSEFAESSVGEFLLGSRARS